jgi:hypothetical protein
VIPPSSTATPNQTPVAGNVYYVSTTGSDTNPGTIDLPWKTIERGVSSLVAGDTLYIRGGIYYQTSTIKLDGVGPNGTSGKMINIRNYPGETPAFDFINSTKGVRGISLANKNYWYIKGIELRNIKQSSAGEFFIGFFANNVNNSILENLNIHHIGNAGFDLAGSSTGNLILNSDFHHNNDFYTGGGNGDGMGFNNTSGTNTVRGVRTWLNSDDGIDAYGAEGKLILENNWAFWNGYYVPEGQPDTNRVHNGDGNGIKLGKTTLTSKDSHYYIVNNLVFENWQSGISQEDAQKSMTIYNNTAYKNVFSCTWGMAFYLNNYDLPHVLRNNLAYKNGSICSGQHNWQSPGDPSLIQDHNSWNMSYTITDNDFVSLDSSVMTNPRKPDGALPDVSFLKLKVGSKLIDASVDVGIPYSGISPDLGAYEFVP